MSTMRLRILAAAIALVATVFATSVTSAGASPSAPPGWMYAGQKALVGVGITGLNPLRNAPCDNCTVEAWMPASTGVNPGQGYVTSVIAQPWAGAPWCEINWKGLVGWTGCWRLAPLF